MEDILFRRLNGYRFSDAYYRVFHGYLGELKFYEYFPISVCHLELFNINLEIDGFQFEVDRMIITGESIYAFDVKHYSMSCDDEGLYWRNKYNKFKSPMSQFEVMKDGLMTYKRYHNLDHRLVCRLVFISEHFYFNRKTSDMLFFKDITPMMSKIRKENHVGHLEFQIRNHFMDIHRPIHHYNVRPAFNMDDVQRGVVCDRCAMVIDLGTESSKVVECSGCASKKSKEKWVLAALNELYLLLNQPIELKVAHLWIGRDHRHITKRVLKKYFVETDKGYIKA